MCQDRLRRCRAFAPGKAEINVRKTARYEGEDCDPLQLAKLGAKGATCIVTFPAHKCSNGLSGEAVRKMAHEHFKVTERLVQSKFSTLGGVDVEVGNGRVARHAAEELILTLSPK